MFQHFQMFKSGFFQFQPRFWGVVWRKNSGKKNSGIFFSLRPIDRVILCRILFPRRAQIARLDIFLCLDCFFRTFKFITGEWYEGKILKKFQLFLSVRPIV